MEYINKIELKGNVGASIKITDTASGRFVRFSLATNYLYSDKDGNPNSETTWHNIIAWEGKNIPDIDSISKGDYVHVRGRVRTSKFTGTDGTEKQVYEIVAGSLEREPAAKSQQVQS